MEIGGDRDRAVSAEQQLLSGLNATGVAGLRVRVESTRSSDPLSCPSNLHSSAIDGGVKSGDTIWLHCSYPKSTAQHSWHLENAF